MFTSVIKSKLPAISLESHYDIAVLISTLDEARQRPDNNLVRVCYFSIAIFCDNHCVGLLSIYRILCSIPSLCEDDGNYWMWSHGHTTHNVSATATDAIIPFPVKRDLKRPTQQYSQLIIKLFAVNVRQHKSPDKYR